MSIIKVIDYKRIDDLTSGHATPENDYEQLLYVIYYSALTGEKLRHILNVLAESLHDMDAQSFLYLAIGYAKGETDREKYYKNKPSTAKKGIYH